MGAAWVAGPAAESAPFALPPQPVRRLAASRKTMSQRRGFFFIASPILSVVLWYLSDAGGEEKFPTPDKNRRPGGRLSKYRFSAHSPCSSEIMP